MGREWGKRRTFEQGSSNVGGSEVSKKWTSRTVSLMDLQRFAEGQDPEKPEEGNPILKAIEGLSNLVQGLVEKLEAHVQAEEGSVAVPDVPPVEPQPAQEQEEPAEGQPPAAPGNPEPVVQRPRWL